MKKAKSEIIRRFRLTGINTPAELASFAAILVSGALLVYLRITDFGALEEIGWKAYAALGVVPVLAVARGPRAYRIAAGILLLFILLCSFHEYRRFQWGLSHYVNDSRLP